MKSGFATVIAIEDTWEISETRQCDGRLRFQGVMQNRERFSCESWLAFSILEP